MPTIRARRRRHQRLGHAARQQHRAHRTLRRGDVPERIQDAHHRTEQPEHRRKHAHIHDIEHALVHRRRDPVALRLRDDLDRLRIRIRVPLQERQRAGHDARRRLRALADVVRQALHVLVLEERRLDPVQQVRRRDALFRQREEAVDHQRQRHHRGQGEGDHHPARRGHHVQQRCRFCDLCHRVIVVGSLRPERRRGREPCAGRQNMSFHE